MENSSLRKDITKSFYSFMKEVAGISNHNLIRNSNAYMSNSGKIEPDFPFLWVDNSYEQSQQKFLLGY